MKQKPLWNNKELFAKETLFEMLSKYTKYDLESNSIKKKDTLHVCALSMVLMIIRFVIKTEANYQKVKLHHANILYGLLYKIYI